jgi:outer membrane protein assembly factor BamB
MMSMNAMTRNLACCGLAIGALAASAAQGGDWPQWRGPKRDGLAAPGETPVRRLPAELKPVWQRAIGPGFSSPIVTGGKVIYLDAQGGKEVAHALDPRDGGELWRHELAPAFGDEWGQGPRSTPFADGELLFVQSCTGEFRCLSLRTGALQWRTNFQDFGVTFLGNKALEGTAARRGNNGSGVAEGGRVFVPVGSAKGATVVAFDRSTGRELWRAMQDEAAYSSLVVGTLGGVRQVVAFTAEALVGLDAGDGRLLWRVAFRTAAKRHAATPVLVGDLVLVNSQTIGLVATRISRESGQFKATEAWANRPLKINIATPVLVDGHLYSAGCNKDYVCVEAGTGAVKWSQAGFGRGRKDYCATIAVGDTLLVQVEDGQLVLMSATPQRYTELGRLQVCGSTWCHPAFAQSRLYVRDERALKCLDLSGQ